MAWLHWVRRDSLNLSCQDQLMGFTLVHFLLSPRPHNGWSITCLCYSLVDPAFPVTVHM